MSDISQSEPARSGSIRFGQIIRRVPFTLCIVVILLVAAWWTGSYFQQLTHAWINRLGFAPRDFWFLRWERLILTAFVTSGGLTFWLALGMVAFASAVMEWVAGSWRTALTFWGVHLATLVIESLLFLLPLHQLGFPQARGVFFSRDVGPSAGYMGCLGFATTFLPKPWRWIAFGVILAYLIASIFLPGRAGEIQALKMSDDIAHLIAYPLGLLMAYIIGYKQNK